MKRISTFKKTRRTVITLFVLLMLTKVLAIIVQISKGFLISTSLSADVIKTIDIIIIAILLTLLVLVVYIGIKTEKQDENE